MDEQPLESGILSAEINIGRARALDGSWVFGAKTTFEGVDYEVFGFKTEREAVFALWAKAFPGKKITLSSQAAWSPLMAEKPNDPEE